MIGQNKEKQGLRYYESPFHVTHDQTTADRKVKELDMEINHKNKANND